jgi:quinone-modifying oxidoreductase, subunit QmoC
MSTLVEERPAIRVEESLLPELERFGAIDVSACFNCGTCTAVCPLSSNDGTFPRRLIRSAQLGMRDELLASPELWACYACGECTQTCPRQADPGGFMAAARRYAIAGYDRSGLARRLSTSVPFAVGTIALLVLLFGAFLYGDHRDVTAPRLAPFEYVPAWLVHDLGLVVLGLFALGAIAGLVEMGRRLGRDGRHLGETVPDGDRGRVSLGDAVWYAVGRESIGQARMRQECADDPEVGDRPWFRQRWFLHAATMWGFLGLLAATILDYVLALTGVRTTGTAEPFWYPVRLLGTIAGLLLAYGTTVTIVRRLRHADRSSARTTLADWWFLGVLWFAGVTGFAIEVALYAPESSTWGYAVFLAHVAVSMTLIVLAPFGKFAHAFYRPVALGVLRRRGTGSG